MKSKSNKKPSSIRMRVISFKLLKLDYPFKAAAPLTISVNSVVIAA